MDLVSLTCADGEWRDHPTQRILRAVRTARELERCDVVVGVKPGARYRSVVCDTEVIVIKTPTPELDLRCGGHSMVSLDDAVPKGLKVEPGFGAGTLIGKRYTDGEQTVELLCTKGGASSLSLGADLLEVKQAKPLPSSD